MIDTYAAAAGLEIVHQIGLGAIEARVGELSAGHQVRGAHCGYRLATPLDPARHGAMIAIRTHDEQRLVSELLARDIVTSCRDGNVRIAPHFYNDWTTSTNCFARCVHSTNYWCKRQARARRGD